MIYNRIRITPLIMAVVLMAAAGSSSSANVSVNASASNTNVASITAAAATNAAAVDQSSTAAALVANLYKVHNAKKSPFFQTRNRALVDKYFTKQLADLIWKDAVTSKGEVGALDGDPLYNAQDVEIKNFAIGKADVKGDTATVPVTFTNLGTKQKITFALKQVKGVWKISDINYGGGETIMKWLKGTGN